MPSHLSRIKALSSNKHLFGMLTIAHFFPHDNDKPNASSTNFFFNLTDNSLFSCLFQYDRGGKGKGGRGISRRTIQPRDVILQNVNLEYVSDSTSGSTGTKTLLEGVNLKLLSGKVYALIGRNGSGKSTLLRRMSQKKIPGFTSLHLKTMYIQQEVFDMDTEMPLDMVVGCSRQNQVESKEAAEGRIQQLEEDIDGLDLECEDDGGANMLRMEEICNEISALEEYIANEDGADLDSDVKFKAEQVLEYFGITKEMQDMPMGKLSGGQKKKVLLASSLFCDIDLLLLDGEFGFPQNYG